MECISRVIKISPKSVHIFVVPSKDLAIQTANAAKEKGIPVRSLGSHVANSDSGKPDGEEGGYLIVAVANR